MINFDDVQSLESRAYECSHNTLVKFGQHWHSDSSLIKVGLMFSYKYDCGDGRLSMRQSLN